MREDETLASTPWWPFSSPRFFSRKKRPQYPQKTPQNLHGFAWFCKDLNPQLPNAICSKSELFSLPHCACSTSCLMAWSPFAFIGTTVPFFLFCSLVYFYPSIFCLFVSLSQLPASFQTSFSLCVLFVLYLACPRVATLDCRFWSLAGYSDHDFGFCVWTVCLLITCERTLPGYSITVWIIP